MPPRRALSIRQLAIASRLRRPYAELILRGEKTIEYCSRPTRIISERFYNYAARSRARYESEQVRNQTTAFAAQDACSQGDEDLPALCAALRAAAIVVERVVSRCGEQSGGDSTATIAPVSR